MASYISDFLVATRKTTELGLDAVPFSVSDAPGRLTREHGEALVDIAGGVLASQGKLAATDVACRCASVSKLMKEHVERVTGYRAILTIGSASYNGTPLIEVGNADLREMARTGTYHVWLTFPWMEIIDFTLQVSIMMLKGRAPDCVSPIAGYPESLRPYSWKPLYVGAAATDILLNPS